MDADRLVRVIEASFPEIKVRKHGTVAQGWSSWVLEVNERYMFRFPKRPEAETNIRKEIRLLPSLAKSLSVRIPRFDFVWEGGDQFPYLFVGYRKIDGSPLSRWCSMSPHAKSLASQLSTFLTELHGFSRREAERRGVPYHDQAKWQERYEVLYADVRRRAFPLLPPTARRKVELFFEGFLGNDDNFAFTPALVHADLAGIHVLCDRDRGRVKGVIDWEDAQFGDPALDFTGLLGDCGEVFTERVLEGYGGDMEGDFMLRTRNYLDVVPFYEILYGLDFDRPHVKYGLDHLRSRFLRQ